VPRIGETAARTLGARAALARAGGCVDLVHGHFLLGVGPAAVRLARRLGVPAVLTAHGTDVRFLESGLPPRRRDEILAACGSASTVIAVSGDLAGRLERLGVPSSSLEVLSMGVDASLYAPADREAARRTVGIPADARVVLFVGRVTPEKGVLVLADAVARLAEPVVTVAAGAPDVRPDGVRLLGVLEPGVLATWLAAADVVCLPSFSEGMPVSVAEALAAGRPVVASAVGGIPEQIESALNGLLVPAGDAAALAAALDEALRREWSPAALRASSRRFWWESISERLDAIYRRALV
jgi:glycosyltransferase involved in cell wall biosynthesis